MMTEYVYIVHSDVDENNVYQEFDTFDEALEYAKGYDNGLTFQTFIDQVEINKDDYGSIELGESERVWSYIDELDEELNKETNLELDAEDLMECGGADIIKNDDGLNEDTHPSEPQPETDHRAAFNAALKIAQESGKPVIYGYHGPDHHGSTRAFTIDPIVCDDLRASTLTAMKKYHPSGSLFVAYPNQEFVEEVCNNCESLEDTVEADLKDVWDPNEDTYELYFNNPFDANEMRKHEKICEDADFNPDDAAADYWDAEAMKYEDEFKELNGEARYRIENDDPRMPDFKIYEADYNIKCDLVDQALGSGDGVDVWEVSGREQDILDFINEYGLEYVSERLDESYPAEEKAFADDLDGVDFSEAYDFDAMREALREAEGEDDEELDEVDEVDAVETSDEPEVEAAAIIEEKPEDVDVKVDVVVQGTDELSDQKIIDAIEEIAADNKKLDDDMRIVTDVVTVEPENTETEDEENAEDESKEETDEQSEDLTEAVAERVFKIYTVFDDNTEIDQIKKGIKPAQLRKLMRDAACADDVKAVYASEIIDGEERAMDKYSIENKARANESVEDVKQLESEEKDAIASYDKHIKSADSDKEAEIYNHIKDDEKEHLSELSELEDAVKTLEDVDVDESLNLNKEFHDIDKKHASEHDSENLSLNEEKVNEDFKQCTGAGDSDTSVQCAFCGKVHPVADMKEVSDGVWKCKDCEKDNEELVAGCAEKECKKNPVIAHEKDSDLKESVDNFWLDSDAFDLDF